MRVVKRICSLVMTFVMFFTLSSAFLVNVSAADDIPTFDTLDEIEENWEFFHNIRYGDITAEYKSGGWYYRFTENGYPTLRIKATAFMTQPQNGGLAKDNAGLTNMVNSKDEKNWNAERVCYYNTIPKKERVSLGYPSFTSYDTYKTNMYRMHLNAYANKDSSITLSAVMYSCVAFSYSTKVLQEFDFENTRYYTAITPYDKATYEKALVRLPKSNVDSLYPTAELAVVDTDSKGIYLSTYTASGFGKWTVESDTQQLAVGVGTLILDAAQLAAFAVEPSKLGTISALASLFEMVDTTTGLFRNASNGEYKSLPERSLSSGRIAREATYKSPVPLSQTDDYFQVVTNFNRSKTGTNVKFLVKYSFKN